MAAKARGRSASGAMRTKGIVEDAKAIFKRAGKRVREGAARRIWELDALRGALVLLMAAYHIAYTAHYVGLSRLDPNSGGLGFSAVLIASGFLLVSGASLRIHAVRAAAKGAARPFALVLRRSLAIAIPALAVTAATFLFAGAESFVAFGILHCMAVSGVIAYPFLKRPRLAWVAGLAIAVPGFLLLKDRGFDPGLGRWLFWLGIRPSDYYPIDYVPLIPWAGLVLMGVFLGSLFFSPKGERAYAWRFPGQSAAARALSFLGRHSLLIYVAHIPAIMGILLAVKWLLGLIGGTAP